MVWQAFDRRTRPIAPSEEPGLTPALRDKINELTRLFPRKQGALLPALEFIQKEHRYISSRAVEELAPLLEITASDILDAMTLYSHLWRKPRGRHMIIACHGISCDICGHENLFHALEEKLKIGEYETTPDGRFSLATEDCIGNCEKAPCLLIDDECIGPVRAEDLDRILDNYK